MLKSGSVARGSAEFQKLAAVEIEGLYGHVHVPLVVRTYGYGSIPGGSAAENTLQIDEFRGRHHRDDDEDDGEDAGGGCCGLEGVA